VQAVNGEAALGAPTVGTWRPLIAAGTILVPGLKLGEIVRIDRTWPVTVPEGARGAARKVAPAGWVGWLSTIVEIGTLDATIAEDTSGGSGAVAEDGLVAVRAETDGTVYLRPDPASPPFAAVGAPVAAHATLALVEVMKTFSPIRAPFAGTLVRVTVENAASVEAGAAVFWLKPG
jgi:biotin carboxyl carrier protein